MTQRGTGDTTMSRARQASRDPCTPHNEIARGRAFVLGASVRKRHFPNAARALCWIRDGRAPPRDRMRLRGRARGRTGQGTLPPRGDQAARRGLVGSVVVSPPLKLDLTCVWVGGEALGCRVACGTARGVEQLWCAVPSDARRGTCSARESGAGGMHGR